MSENKLPESVPITNIPSDEIKDKSKRSFVTTAAFSVAGVGAACAVLPFIDSMNPSSDVAALASIEVDISGIKEGEQKKVMWQGKPVFIVHRNKKEIDEAEATDVSELRDPQKDSDRVKKKEWLVVIGVCTHLGCIPLFGQGEFDGWFCPCHGSQYDSSARIRKGPAPRNLDVPPYEFLSDTKIKIG